MDKNKYFMSVLDRDIWANELENFVPSTVFDMHTHLWCDNFAGISKLPEKTGMRTNFSINDLNEWNKQAFPGRKVGFLALATPVPGMDSSGFNNWLADSVTKYPGTLAGMSVTPQMTPEMLEKQVKKHNFFALKPYRLHAENPADAGITDFLPENLLECANSLGLAIVLHMSRQKGAADNRNLDDLSKFTQKYPNLRWILAHCARGFNPATIETALDRLRDMPHIMYDTSAVCDIYSQALLLKKEKIERIMFGSDNIMAGGIHGKYITYGESWQFFAGDRTLEHCPGEATLVMYEQLLAQKRACELTGTGKEEIEQIFHKNAAVFIEKTQKMQNILRS